MALITHHDKVMNQRELGAFFGVTQKTVSMWKKAGLVHEEADGTYSLQAAAKAIAKRKGNGSNRERLEAAKADMAEHDLAVARGEFTPIEDEATMMARAGAALQSRLMAIPPGLADALAAEEDPAKVLRVLTAEITEALEQLWRELRGEADDVEEAWDDDDG